MCRAQRGEDVHRLSEFLTAQQIKSFFSRQAAKNASNADVLAIQEETNFCNAQSVILSSLVTEHPISCGQYNVCQMVEDDSLRKLSELYLDKYEAPNMTKLI